MTDFPNGYDIALVVTAFSGHHSGDINEAKQMAHDALVALRPRLARARELAWDEGFSAALDVIGGDKNAYSNPYRGAADTEEDAPW